MKQDDFDFIGFIVFDLQNIFVFGSRWIFHLQPCDPGTKDYREIQCSYFDNNLKLQGLPSNVRWVPKYAGSMSSYA